jgi:HD-like signal output (HDOD) protein
MHLHLLFSSPEEIASLARTLPASPKVMLSLLPLIDDPDKGMDPLVSLLKLEPGLSARIMHVANSPFYSFGGTVGAIEEAVQRIGYAEVHRLAMLILGLEFQPQPLRAYGLETKEIWNHSIAVACGARHLAEVSGENPGRAYTVGLLHNVGMVGINALIRKRAPSLRFPAEPWPELWRTSEIRVLGFDQNDAGAALLRNWGFPDPLIDAVRNQMRPHSAHAGKTMAATLHLARWVCAQIFTPDNSSPPPDPETVDLVGTSLAELIAITEKVTKDLDKAWRQLGLGGAPD